MHYYSKLLEDLEENDFTQGQGNYPAMLQQAYSLLIHWKQDPQHIIQLIGGVNDGMAFMNVGTEDMGHVGRNSTSRKRSSQQWCCFNCNQFGHIAWDCLIGPDHDNNADATTTRLLMQGIDDLITNDSYQFTQHNGHLSKSWWILLDTSSTINVFLNKALLKNVRETNHYMMCIHCNAGWSYTNKIGRHLVIWVRSGTTPRASQTSCH